VKVWSNAQSLTIDKVIEGGYTRYLPAFESLIPALQKAWQQKGFIPDSLNKQLDEAIQILGTWDLKTDARSIATTLAIEWGQRLLPAIQRTEVTGIPDAGFVEKTQAFAATATSDALLQPLQATLNDLKRRFPGWKVPWGEINRYQRLTGNMQEIYDDSKPSIPANFAAATWGALPSYVSRQMKGSNRRYGFSGNSFICAVEFGEKIKAKSLLAGGNNSNPTSKHFGDQAKMYTEGKFKEVLFYKEDVMKHVERKYQPGK
jgi:acyl-homoserine lactone acylase PvdQ